MPLQSGTPPVDVSLGIYAWNMLGGMDWAGIPYVSDMLGYPDPEILIVQLMTIRAFQDSTNE